MLLSPHLNPRSVTNRDLFYVFDRVLSGNGSQGQRFFCYSRVRRRKSDIPGDTEECDRSEEGTALGTCKR